MITRDRRAVIWGAVSIATMVVVLRLIPVAFRALTRLRETAVERQATVARAQLLLGERGAVRDSLDHVLRDIVGLVPRLVDGTSQADAQASLSSLVSMAATRHNLKILRLNPVSGGGADDTMGVFVRVQAHGEFEGDVTGAARLLRALETSTTLLTVSSLGITATNPVSRSDRPEILNVELNVSGYYLPRPAQ